MNCVVVSGSNLTTLRHVIILYIAVGRGILNALNACGAYGTGDTQTGAIVNIGNSISYGVLGWITGSIVNKLGYRVSSLIGAVQTTILLSLIVARSLLHLVPLYVIWVVGLIDGIASGLIWNSVSTITVVYPPPHQRGLATTVLFTVFSGGAALGGLCSFFLFRDGANHGSSALSLNAFMWMTGVTMVAIVLALLIKPSLSDVKYHSAQSCNSSEVCLREVDSLTGVTSAKEADKCTTGSTEPADGEDAIDSISMTTEMSTNEFIQTIKDLHIHRLLIFAFASLFHQTYLFNGLNYRVFSVRTRGLNCFMYWIGRIPAGFVHGHLVDEIGVSSTQRAKNACMLLAGYVILSQLLCFTFYLTVYTGGRYLDIGSDLVTVLIGFLVFLLYGGLDTVSQAFAMWLFSVIGTTPTSIPHYIAVYRSVQGFGVAFAWFLDLRELLSYEAQFALSVCCWVLAFPGLLRVIHSIVNEDVSKFPQGDAAVHPVLFSSIRVIWWWHQFVLDKWKKF